MTGEPIHILLVEDDEVDAETVILALRAQRIANPVTIARDGVEALEILRGSGARPALPRPNLILLDLNLPRMNGLETLEALRADEHLRDSIVFVLTTSNDDRDKAAAYERNVAGYLLKSRVGEDFTEVLGMLGAYWRVIEFPPASRA